MLDRSRSGTMVKHVFFIAIALAATAMCQVASAQIARPQPGQPGGNRGPGGGPGGAPGNRNNGQQGNRPEEKPEVKLPDDPRLIDIHKAFVAAAEKLAAEYERTNNSDKARACYEEILRLVPTYTPAEEKLKVIQAKEATAERRAGEVFANKGWQDVGINVVAGKPLAIKATGSWTMKMTYVLPPDGIEIPKELQNFPLGALVGKIATSPTDEDAKVFLIGAATNIKAEQDGRLFLRIYDSDPDDNLGKVSVVIEGTFKK
jgi:hypothetical protein